MANVAPHQVNPDDDIAEIAALTAAVDVARADDRLVPHDDVRFWLLRLAAGEFGAEPPQPK